MEKTVNKVLTEAIVSGVTTHNLSDAMEELVDKLTLSEVLGALSDACGYMAEKVGYDPENEKVANKWDQMSEKLDALAYVATKSKL